MAERDDGAGGRHGSVARRQDFGGEAPVSKGRVLLVIAAVIAALLVIFLLFQLLRPHGVPIPTPTRRP